MQMVWFRHSSQGYSYKGEVGANEYWGGQGGGEGGRGEGDVMSICERGYGKV